MSRPASVRPVRRSRFAPWAELPHLRVLLLLLLFGCGVRGWTQTIQPVPGSTAVGSTSAPFTVTVTFQSPGVASSIVAVTSGNEGGDFSLVPGGTCATSIAYASGNICTERVTFTPAYPGQRMGAILVRDGSGTALGTALISARATGGLPMFVPGTVRTFAGQGDWTYTGDNVPATSAPIFTPRGVLLDFQGNLYLADNGNNRIRRVDAQTGTISTVAGTGSPSFSGDNGAATAAELDAPAGLAMDGAGNLYFADELNNVVRRIDAASQIITTVAGTGRTRGYAGDGGAATAAVLNRPLGVSFDLQGNLLIADTGNNVVRVVNASNGTISTLAGTGTAGYNGDGTATSSQLNGPSATLTLPDGTVLIADTGNNRVRSLSLSGTLSTFAGNGAPQFQGDGSSATAASLKQPVGLAADPAGNIYVADSGNNRIRLIAVGTQQISTIMGTDSEAFTGDDGPANLASMYDPFSLFFAQDGTLYVSDLFHMRIRGIVTDYLWLMYPTMRVGKTSAPQPVTLTNRGNDSLLLSSFVFQQSALDSNTTSCNTTTPLLSLQSCQLGVEFTPTVVGSSVNGSLQIPSDAIHITPTVLLYGQVLSVNPTSATVVSSKNPSILGDSVIFTATVTSDDTHRTGDVTILSDGATLCTMALRADGTASCTTSNLALGSHAIVAQYAGDAQNAAATSPALTQVVKQATTLQLTSSSNPVTVTAPVTFVLNASAATGTPTGNILFMEGASTLGTGTLASGRASLTVSNLAPGTHNITAVYAGDANDAAGQSNTLPQVVQQADTVTMLNVSNASPTVGNSITFAANVSSPNGPAPAGTVQFLDGTTPLGTGTLTVAGTTTFSTAALAPGSHTITAVYSGDTDDAGSTSAPLALTVQQIVTGTTLAADSNPLSAGATLHLLSTVSLAPGATAQGTVTGTVVFREGSTVYATVPLDGAQQAATDVHNLPVGSHLLTATYSGNTNYAGSSSTLTVVVNQTASTISLTDAANTTLAGKPASWTAAVASSTGIPTGTVIFRDGATTLGSATLDAHGVATFTTSTLPVGTRTITANYTGDANYIAITSAPITHVVNRAVPTLTLNGPSLVNVTANASFSMALSHPGVTPTGTVNLLDGGTVIASLPVTAAGTNSFDTASLALGQHSIVASYSGDSYNDPVSSPAIVVNVQKAPTATTLVSSGSPVTLGSAVTLSATVTAPTPNLTGTVNFYDGAAVIGSAVLNNGSATFTTSQFAFGHHPLSAAYAGSNIHAESRSATVDESIRQQASIAVVSSLNPSNSGQSITFTATMPSVGGLLPTGSVTFLDNGAAIGTGLLDAGGRASLQTANLAVGNHTVAVSFGGESNYSAATASLSQRVDNANSKTVETVSANPATYGAPLVLTATVTTNGGVATGQVLFTENGSTVGNALLNGTGVATLTTVSLAPGRHSVVANYQTDGRASSSSSEAVSFLVQQKTALAVSFDSNPALTLSPVVITATLTNSNAAPATGNITFFDGAANLGSAPLAGGVASLTVPVFSAGTHAISARYAGDDGNFAALAPTVNEVVKQRATNTSLTSSSTNVADPQQVTLIAIVQSPTLSATDAPTGSVTFTQGQVVIGTVAITKAGLATLNQELEVGAKENVVATYSGDANYLNSTSATVAVQSGPPVNFTLSTNTAQVQLQSGQHSMLTVTLTSIKGFNDTIRLGCAGLPYAATCTFTQTNPALAADGTQTTQLMVDTGDPLGSGASTTTASNRSSTPGAPLLALLPAGVLLLLYRKRRIVPILAGVLLLSALTLGNSGCNGLRMSSTPAGSYTFQVTGVGIGSGAKQTQTVTLVVGQ